MKIKWELPISLRAWVAQSVWRLTTGWTIGVCGFDSWLVGPRALSPGVKLHGREADHSPPSSAEVREWVELYLHSPNMLSWRGAQLKEEHRDNCTTLAPWNRVLLEKLTVAHITTTFTRFYGNRRFITVFTTSRYLSLCWARWIHSTSSHPNSLTSILILSSRPYLSRPSVLLPWCFPTNTPYAFILLYSPPSVPRSRMRGTVPHLPQYNFKAWCSVKAQGQLYLTLLYLPLLCVLHTQSMSPSSFHHTNNIWLIIR
jgi:hypothetical protein